MRTTRVTVKALFNQGPLLAVVDVVLDDHLVVKDIRVVECENKTIVARPCRKAVVRCTACSFKNNAGANFCTECGTKIQFQKLADTRLYTDIVHPVTVEFRTVLTRDIIAAYEAERLARTGASIPGQESGFSSAVSSQFLRAVEQPPSISDDEAPHRV